MSELVQPIGLGMAARGEVSDVIGWADDARRMGVESVWIHDSYFERDAVTYASAIAAQVPEIKVALGALNPFTRHPVVLAMTISAIDEMAPGRVILGMGTGLPLRLAQMGIPYTPDAGVQRVSEAIDLVRKLWAGERVPSFTPNLMPIQPMFPPVHQVPIYIAAYRTPFLELAGQKAEGYLARPAESIANLKRMVAKIRKASVDAGRPENAVRVSGYLLTLVDETRREALNRAKREPFVIYMMGILSDFTLQQAGFEKELRDQIATAWRAEDYNKAANLIPDELLDAFMLCGTREDVAAGAWRYHEAGMDVPVLQPVVQNSSQMQAILDAAVIYGTQQVQVAPAPMEAHGGVGVGVGVGAHGGVVGAHGRAPLQGSPVAVATSNEGGARLSLGEDRQLGLWSRIRRHAGAWFEIARPFSFTASTAPVAAAGALAVFNGKFDWLLFLAAFIAAVMLHIGTNVTNEVYDVRVGIDTITSPRASHALLKGRLSEREAFTMVGVAFAVAVAIGAWLIAQRGWPVAALGIAGLLGGFGYTAPPLQYKYRALGLPLVFLLMGPLMVLGAYYVVTGEWSWQALALSIPVGFLVTAILHGNEWRDISDDARAGVATLSIRYGRNAAHIGYVSLVVGAYLALTLGVQFGVLPPASLLAMLSLPLLVRAIRASELGASGQQRAIAMIDLETAQLHAAFGYLLVLGLVSAVFVGAVVK